MKRSDAPDSPVYNMAADSLSRTAVVFFTHTLHNSVRDRFEKLRRETSSEYDVYFAYDETGATDADMLRAAEVAGDCLRTFSMADIPTEEYPAPWADPQQQTLVPGNLDLFYRYFREHESDYDRYWFVEYDVAYTGRWSEFFRVFDDVAADLLGTTLRSYERDPSWYWWGKFEPAADLPRRDWLCGFFPIVRLSTELLDRLDEAYRAGWSGHAEAVLPTLARSEGLSVVDINGNRQYGERQRRKRFYTNTIGPLDLAPGTFIYRPSRARPGFRSGTLYHPVKPSAGRFRPYLRYLKRWLSVRIFS
jgi:hypothetical protein